MTLNKIKMVKKKNKKVEVVKRNNKFLEKQRKLVEEFRKHWVKQSNRKSKKLENIDWIKKKHNKMF